MFGRKKVQKQSSFEREKQIPVIKSSICTGEKVAGFKDRATGKFEDVMLIRDEKDLKSFLEMYQIEENELHKEY